MAKIFIASTYLHLIDALILNQEDYLFFITKKEDDFLKKVSPYFKNIYQFIDDKKINTRIQNAKKMISISQSIQPDEIVVGNDRKIETSILIHNFKANYSYMDDGLHSYILEKQYPFKYSIFEKILKMIMYKNRLDVPKFIGCNSYIKKAYLFKPEFANECLRKKELIKLNINDIPQIKLDININCKNILLLPHPKFINESIKRIKLKDFCVKYHPRDKNRYFDAPIIPNIPLEILLLNISRDIKIYGFQTTAILIAKWLGFEVFNFVFEDNKINKFMSKNGIKEIRI
jgi:hypothetical protein